MNDASLKPSDDQRPQNRLLALYGNATYAPSTSFSIVALFSTTELAISTLSMLDPPFLKSHRDCNLPNLKLMPFLEVYDE